MLLLFQKESCPYCQKVVSYFSDKGVDYISITSNRGDKSRAILEKLGGKQQVPFLVDVDQGLTMYESDDIIAYVTEHYLN